MEIFDLSFGSWMLIGIIFCLCSIPAELIARWLTPKVLKFFHREK